MNSVSRINHQFMLVVVFIILIPYLALAENDSLLVQIVNTTESISKIRFIERDSTNLIMQVLDEKGNTVEKLAPEQVQISRGQRYAKIMAVNPLHTLTEKNVYAVLALDNSASMSDSRKELLYSIEQLFEMLNGKSEFSLALFDEKHYHPTATTRQIDDKSVNVTTYDFTSDLDTQLNNIRLNYRGKELTSRTYLYDEVIVALEQIEKIPTNRLRILIVLSDGKDLGSQFGLNRVLQDVAKSGVTIYGIDYSQSPQIEKNLQRIVSAAPHGKAYKAKNTNELISVFGTLTEEIVNEFQVSYRFLSPPFGDIRSNSDSLTIISRQLTDEFPMLNYVFFDSNSTTIDNRYHTFDTAESAHGFNENKIAKPIDKYYHILNVIGQRAQQNPTAKLILTGCNMNTDCEKNNLELACQRAEAVSQYFQNIWKIAPARIVINKRNLPGKPSSTRSFAGRAENRRVEISSDNSTLMVPIRSARTEFVYQPEIGVFQTEIGTPEGLKEWKFRAFSGTEELYAQTFRQSKDKMTWNWLSNTGDKIKNLQQLSYKIEITDNMDQTFTSPPKIVNISEITTSGTFSDAQSDTVYEKFSLILFDFNSSKLSNGNTELMQKVVDLYNTHSDANVEVLGYSDDIGAEKYNSTLSKKRARMAYNRLKKLNIPQKQLSYKGYGEINPLFSNSLPEGRFLNRTVQILVKYPKHIK